MNGRLYDPLLGRMLSPDPYIMGEGNTQGYNRYIYALNNPMKYTDPTGEYAIVDDIIAAAVGGIINLAVNAFQGNLGGHAFWGGVGRGFAAIGAGAAGDIGAIYPEFGGWIWGGATVGATNAWLSDASTGQQIAQGAFIGAFSGAVGGAAGSVVASRASAFTSSISSPVLRGAITGTLGGASGGYAGGYTGSLLINGDLNAAHQAGMDGLWTGALIGGTSGVVGGYRDARQQKIDPFTGKPNFNYIEKLPIDGIPGPRMDTKPSIFDDMRITDFKRGKINADVDGGFSKALAEWNSVRNQYGKSPVDLPALPEVRDHFNFSFPDGSKGQARFYYGGKSNPNGWNIKINTIFNNQPKPNNIYIR